MIHLCIHTKLLGLHYYRLDCIVQELMCYCWVEVDTCATINASCVFLIMFCVKTPCPYKIKCPLMDLYAPQVCTMVCVDRFVRAMFATLTAAGTAGTDWLHNLVCSCCLASWMADSRLQTHTHLSTHAHTYAHMNLFHPLQMVLVIMHSLVQAMYVHICILMNKTVFRSCVSGKKEQKQ